LLYRAYALFGDDRLPSEYIGSGSEREDTGLISDITDALGTLSPTLEAELIPFTLRPSAEGSWLNPGAATVGTRTIGRIRRTPPSTITVQAAAVVLDSAVCWDDPAPAFISRRSNTNPLRVWTMCLPNELGGDSLDRMQAALAIADRVWPHLVGLMGPPKPDNAAGDANVDPANGVGDEAIDIYLVDDLAPLRNGEQNSLGGNAGLAPSAPAYAAVVNPDDFRKSSGYVLLPQSDLWKKGKFQSSLAHELMHVLQFAHNAMIVTSIPGIWWYAEASATWLEAYVDGAAPPLSGRVAANESYWRFSANFQRNTEDPLNTQFGTQKYDAFIWAYFAEQQTDSPNTIGQMWVALEQADTASQGDLALDSVFSFADNFRDFAVRNLNSSRYEPALPRSERYVSQDEQQFPDNIEIAPMLHISHVAPDPVAHTSELQILSSRYWKFTFPDAKTEKVIFDLSDPSLAGLGPALDLDALVKIAGQGWTREDWNPEISKVFCFDKPDEKVEEIWLVANNHLLPAKGGETEQITFEVTVSDVPCQPSWVGTTTLEIDDSHDYRKMQANVRWVYDDAYSVDAQHPNFYPVGTATLVEWVDKTDCDVTYVPASGVILADDFDGSDGLLAIDYTQPEPATYAETGITHWFGRVTYDCPDQDPTVFDPWSIGTYWWMQNPDASYTKLSEDGQTIQGSWSAMINADTTITQSYKFTRQDQ
ncbi:MAG TPA: hypothetical protein VFO62_00795, partial [Candidatus Binatia bacterium]|nr:hypothetical protein [Candidatus Binatia bacterium]